MSKPPEGPDATTIRTVWPRKKFSTEDCAMRRRGEQRDDARGAKREHQTSARPRASGDLRILVDGAVSLIPACAGMSGGETQFHLCVPDVPRYFIVNSLIISGFGSNPRPGVSGSVSQSLSSGGMPVKIASQVFTAAV